MTDRLPDLKAAIGLDPFYVDESGIIYCGDSLEILPRIPDKSVDLVLTDPPYFQPAQTSAGTREKAYKRTLGDMSIFKYAFDIICTQLARVLDETGSLYLFCDSQSFPFLFINCFPLFKSVRTVIWDRINSYNGYTWRRQHEIILWAECGNAPRIPTGDGDIISVRAVLQEDRLHPVQKPIDVITKIVSKYPEDMLILDPFLGSGTTAVAAKQLGRKYIGIEINSEYCRIAAQRLRQMTINL